MATGRSLLFRVPWYVCLCVCAESAEPGVYWRLRLRLGLPTLAGPHTNTLTLTARTSSCRSIKKERIKASQQANAPPELPLKVSVGGWVVCGYPSLAAPCSLLDALCSSCSYVCVCAVYAVLFVLTHTRARQGLLCPLSDRGLYPAIWFFPPSPGLARWLVGRLLEWTHQCLAPVTLL